MTEDYMKTLDSWATEKEAIEAPGVSKIELHSLSSDDVQLKEKTDQMQFYVAGNSYYKTLAEAREAGVKAKAATISSSVVASVLAAQDQWRKANPGKELDDKYKIPQVVERAYNETIATQKPAEEGAAARETRGGLEAGHNTTNSSTKELQLAKLNTDEANAFLAQFKKQLLEGPMGQWIKDMFNCMGSGGLAGAIGGDLFGFGGGRGWLRGMPPPDFNGPSAVPHPAAPGGQRPGNDPRPV